VLTRTNTHISLNIHTIPKGRANVLLVEKQKTCFSITDNVCLLSEYVVQCLVNRAHINQMTGKS